MAGMESGARPEPEGRPESEAAKEAPSRPWSVDPGTAIKVGLGLFLLVVFILFIIQNSDPVRVNFVFFRAQIRLIWVFLGCAVIGGVIAWLVGRPRRRAMKRLIDELERQRQGRGS